MNKAVSTISTGISRLSTYRAGGFPFNALPDPGTRRFAGWVAGLSLFPCLCAVLPRFSTAKAFGLPWWSVAGLLNVLFFGFCLLLVSAALRPFYQQAVQGRLSTLAFEKCALLGLLEVLGGAFFFAALHFFWDNVQHYDPGDNLGVLLLYADVALKVVMRNWGSLLCFAAVLALRYPLLREINAKTRSGILEGAGALLFLSMIVPFVVRDHEDLFRCRKSQDCAALLTSRSDGSFSYDSVNQEYVSEFMRRMKASSRTQVSDIIALSKAGSPEHSERCKAELPSAVLCEYRTCGISSIEDVDRACPGLPSAGTFLPVDAAVKEDAMTERVLSCALTRMLKSPGHDDLGELQNASDWRNERLKIRRNLESPEGPTYRAEGVFSLQEVKVEIRLEGVSSAVVDRSPYACLTIAAERKAFRSSSSRCEDGELNKLSLSAELVSELKVGNQTYEYNVTCQLAALSPEGKEKT